MATATKKRTLSGGQPSKKNFPVVAIGASLGGLKAVIQLLKYLPSNTGMAYIYVQHLSPDHESHLPDILSRITRMKVQDVKHRAKMLPNNIYVIPYNKGIEVTNGHIELLPRSKASAVDSIDTLFISLARTHKKNVLGIVLSGNANDGTAGLEAIKHAGGITFAQNNTAQAHSMPTSAIDAGVVDYVLTPKQIGLELGRFSKNGFKRSEPEPDIIRSEDNEQEMKVLLKHLHHSSSVDFSHYKMTTVKRRIKHRMVQNNVTSLKDYLKLLRGKNDETAALYKDLLINVTSFFRDTDTFRYLKTTFLPRLIKMHVSEKPIRIWVPACSSGEEAYSIAMILMELQEKQAKKIQVQIFATDLSKSAIRDARVGEYSKQDLEIVSAARIKAFFIRTGNTYRISKEVREICVFAPHNLLKDPPFYHIDFISCCNLLIYFDTSAQKKALSTMHFALNKTGFLMLGKSESTNASPSLFKQMNDSYRIYSRNDSARLNKIPDLSSNFADAPGQKKKLSLISPIIKTNPAAALDEVIDTVLLKHHMPACAIINKQMDILQFRGPTGVFLTHQPGKASLNILKMARPEFSLELRSCIGKVIRTQQPSKQTGIKLNARVAGSKSQFVNLDVSPLETDAEETLLLVVFTLQEGETDDTDPSLNLKPGSATAALRKKDQVIKKLTQDLEKARAEIHLVIESQEASNQELQLANEEIISANEEFQTLNEELETSKEEIEATNEELISTNQELQIRNDLLQESYDYSKTIIRTLHEPMLIMDAKLHVKSANKSFYKKFNSRKEDTEGKLIFDLGSKQWNIPGLSNMLDEVINKNTQFDNFEVSHIFPGIGRRTMLLNAHKIVQKNHKEQLILLAINDITERSRLYQREKDEMRKDLLLHKKDNVELERAVNRRTRQLVLKNKQLFEANKDLTSFTYISSHDLQEPLRKIQTFATCILEEEQNLSETGKGYFLRLRAIAERMQALIEDLLKFSRTKNSAYNFEDTELNSILREVASDFEDAIQTKKARISISVTGQTKVLRFQFRQLFHNLISNSLKFSKKHIAPVITIKSKVESGSDIPDQLSDKKKYIHIIYTDNGIGFDPQYKDRIFEVFQRLHSFDEYNGTGIGLAICKRIVENHKGRITANSKPNKGARFDIYLPYE